MNTHGGRIHAYIDDDRAVALLQKYYGGRYTGALFDTAPQLRSTDPDRFTSHDFAAVATLSVPLPGSAIAGLLSREEALTSLLGDVPTDVDLVDAAEGDLAAVFAVQDELGRISKVGHVTRSKLLAHKRSRMVPIRDQHVLRALIGRDRGPFIRPLKEAIVADRSIGARLDELRARSGVPEISPLRALDVVVWMATHGDGQVRS